MRTAHRLARALGCNYVPTTLDRVPLVEGWPGWALPGSPKLDVDTLARWRAAERRDLARGVERFAWALLPGSARVVVLDSDDEVWTERLLERQPTPLVVRSPTAGRAHLYYRWPDGVDLSSRDAVAGPCTYEVKARARTIHAPGSLHHRRQGRYVCSLPPEEQVPGLRERLPVLDLALVEADARLRLGADAEREEWDWGEERWSTDGVGLRRWTALLAATPPAQQGGRQRKLYNVACRAGDLGVPEPQARPGLIAWALACEPPLGEEEARDALRRAYKARRSRIGSGLG